MLAGGGPDLINISYFLLYLFSSKEFVILSCSYNVLFGQYQFFDNVYLYGFCPVLASPSHPIPPRPCCFIIHRQGQIWIAKAYAKSVFQTMSYQYVYLRSSSAPWRWRYSRSSRYDDGMLEMSLSN
jgi:hypothetical protein